MYVDFDAFSVYSNPYMRKKALFLCGMKHICLDGSRNKLGHENSKSLHENEREEHQNLPGSNGEEFR